MRYYLVAGEASGDLHGSNLIKGLKLAEHNGEFRCWGGDLMENQGATLVKHYKESSIMGFVEVITNLNKIYKNLSECKQDIINYNPDVLILIDYPGFNFKIAEFAKKRGIKVYYYIAPKVWAWKESRVKKLKAFTDELFIIFPFEIEYFKNKGIDANYCGNPLLDSVDNYKYSKETKEEFFNRLNLPKNYNYIALLTGSRKSEIKFLLQRVLKIVNNNPDKEYILAAAPGMDKDYYLSIIKDIPKNLNIIYSETYSILKHSDAAVISSGTASLEAALLNTPQVVCYGGNEITFRIAKALVKLKYISLANLILDKGIFKELLQHDCTPETISKELDNLINNIEYRENMLNDYKKVRELLGGKGASKKVAERMITLLKN